MPIESTHLSNSGDKPDLLADAGLTPERVMRARGRAEHDVAECTDFDPRGWRGSTRTARTIRYLREELAPLGWTADNTGSVASVVSPDGRIAVVVTSGDPGTGLIGSIPKTKYQKGPATHQRVDTNLQLSLFEGSPSETSSEGPTDALSDRKTWVLLQHPAGEVVRAELSFPEGFDDGGRISKWGERVILPEFPLATNELWFPEENDGEGGLDIPVTPR